ncbi:MAG: hypothetical protein ABW199_00750 [Caulobacterales bacterium]
MADNDPISASEEDPGIFVIDPNGAPIIYFEGAPNFGCNNGIVNITLAANRNMVQGQKIQMDVLAVAFLRCNIQGAMALRQAIDQALLIGATPHVEPSKAN